MAFRKDITGQRFGRLTALMPVGQTASREWRWSCRCDCGSERIVTGALLRLGRTVSCGCYRDERALAVNTKHGKSQTRTFRIWRCMRDRCSNPKNASFNRYGARGISVCPEWATSFATFLADMGECPRGLSIERNDNDGNYEPGNCRWATAQEQQGNTSRTRFIEAFGERLPLSEWARRSGISAYTIANRLQRGLSPTEALTQPLKGARK